PKGQGAAAALMRLRILVAFVTVAVCGWVVTERPPPLVAQSPAVRYVPGSSQKICQVTGDFDGERQQPTLNQTLTRYGVAGTDLGASFEHQGNLYMLFGDTTGLRPEEAPDSFAFSDDVSPEDCLALQFVVERPGLF